MRKVLYTGRLSPEMTLVANLNNILAWIIGNTQDTAAMKLRVKLGYEGACSSHVTQYDNLALEHYSRIAESLLESVDLDGRDVLDVGCGTGIVSLRALKGGAAKVACGDASTYMLSQCQRKVANEGFAARVEIRELDAESLPYGDGSFDVVMSSMLLGLVPNQQRVVAEMARVLRRDGTFALATHGPDCWWELADGAYKSLPKRYVLGYRVEYWPRSELDIRSMLGQAGLTAIRAQRLLWRDSFASGAEAYEFGAAASASWWLTKLPPHAVAGAARKSREYFESKKIDRVTHDILLAYGRKP